MPREYAKHAVRLLISAGCYNALVAALMESKSGENDCAEEYADALLTKMTKYTRFYLDDKGDESAELRFFESEARHLIWLLLRAYAVYSSDGEDYYHTAIENASAD